MRILLYGRLAEAIGREAEVDAPDGCAVGELRRRLAGAHPHASATLANARACVRSALVPDDYCVAAGDEVELLPPVSGG